MKTQSLSTLTKTQMTNNNEKQSVCCGAVGAYDMKSKKEGDLFCYKCGKPFIAQEEKKCGCRINGNELTTLTCKYHSSPTQSVEEKRDCSKCGTKYGESTKWGTCECPVSPTQDLQKRFCLLMFQILI